MITLEQQDNFLIGKKDDIEAFSQKNRARILIVSDSHGNSDILQKILRQFGPDCDAFVFCGDGLNDVSGIFEEAEIDSDLKKCIPPVAAFVCGNCDFLAYNGGFQMLSFFDGKNVFQFKIPYSQTLKTGSHKMYICHGNIEGVNYGLNRLAEKCKDFDCDIAVYGHTHIAKESYIDEIHTANPGSCSRPRGGQLPGFAILTVQNNTVDFAFLQIQNQLGSELQVKIYSPF